MPQVTWPGSKWQCSASSPTCLRQKGPPGTLLSDFLFFCHRKVCPDSSPYPAGPPPLPKACHGGRLQVTSRERKGHLAVLILAAWSLTGRISWLDLSCRGLPRPRASVRWQLPGTNHNWSSSNVGVQAPGKGLQKDRDQEGGTWSSAINQ